MGGRFYEVKTKARFFVEAVLFLLLLVNVMVPATVSAGTWTWTQRTTAGNRIWTDVAASSDGMKIIAVTAGTSTVTSADGGVTWTARTIPGVTFVWRVVSSSDGTKLAALATASTSVAYVYTSADSGVTWVQRIASNSAVNMTMSADGTKLAFADNYPSGYVWTSSNGGVSWTQRIRSGTSNSSSALHWYDITSSSDGTKLALTSYWGDGITPGFIYTSTDSGVTWTQQLSLGLAGGWFNIASTPDGTKLVATGSIGGSYYYVYYSSDGGVTWTQRPSAGQVYSARLALSPSGTSILIANASGGGIAQPPVSSYLMLSTDSGSTWASLTTPGSHNWYGATFSSDGMRITAVESVKMLIPTNGYLWTGFLDNCTSAAANPWGNGFTVPTGGTYRINSQGYNFCITNSSAKNYYIPAKTAAEVTAFVNRVPYLNGLTMFN